MKTLCANGMTVEHWYDRKTRNSVTQIKDSAGNQIGEAEYSGNYASAQFAKESAIAKNGGRAVRQLAENQPITGQSKSEALAIQEQEHRGSHNYPKGLIRGAKGRPLKIIFKKSKKDVAEQSMKAV